MPENLLIYGLPHPDYLPLIRTLAGQGFNLVMNTTPLSGEAKATGIRFRPFEEFITPEIEAHAQREAARISTALLENTNQEMTLQAFASPLGNFLPHTGQAFFDQLLSTVTKGIVIIEALDNLLSQGDLRLTILDCDNDCAQRTLVNYLRLQGVPSLHLAHGLYPKPQIHVAGEVDRLYSDYLTVFGTRARENCLRCGNPPERVFITGNPLWDSLYTPAARISTREARRRLGLDPDRPVVLFCSSYAEGSSAYFRSRTQQMQDIHEAVMQNLAPLSPHVQLVVRPHPGELNRAPISAAQRDWVIKAYQRWLEQTGVFSPHLSFGNKIDAIRAADLVIVAHQSTVIPEAMILEKPVIMVTLLKDYPTIYTESDGIIVVDEEEKLAGLADLIASPSARAAMVQRQNTVLPELNHGHDGRAMERVAELIGRLARPLETSPDAGSGDRICRPTPASAAATTAAQSSSWMELDQVFTTTRRKLFEQADWRYGPKRVREVAREAFEALASVVPLEGKVFCDLGCGEHHPLGTSTLMFLNGVRETIALDKVGSDTGRDAEALFDLLVECLIDPEAWHWSQIAREDFISKINQFDLKTLKSGNLEKGLAGAALTHRVEDILTTDIVEHIDLMSSRAVLEHCLDFRAALNKLFAMMTPGGIAFHHIDLTDHRAYIDPTRFHWWSFLAEADDWSDGLCNRLRASEIRESLERAGFAILNFEGRRVAMPAGFRRLLKGRFAQMTDEELETVTVKCLIKKPEVLHKVEQGPRLPEVRAQFRAGPELTRPESQSIPATCPGWPDARCQPEPGEPREPTPRLDLLFVNHNFLPHSRGGTEIYTHDLALAMQERGHRLTVMYPRPIGPNDNHYSLIEGRYGSLPVVEIITPANSSQLVRHESLKEVVRSYLSGQSFDVVHIQHLMSLSVSFLEVLQELRIPMVLTANDFWFLCHQIHLVSPEGTVCTGPQTIDKCVRCWIHREPVPHESHLPYRFFYLADRFYAHRQAFRIPDLILCPSRFLMKIIERYGFSNDNVVHLPQGANLFSPLPRSERPDTPIIFSFLGTINYRKGLDLLIKAFNSVDTSRAELHIYGDTLEPEYFDRVMAQIQPGKVVKYHGGYAPADLPLILSNTDVAVVPSRGENYPFVIREILHAGVPVIASRVGGIPEIVKDGKNGLLFTENDVEDLAGNLAQVLARPEILTTLRAGIEPMKAIARDADEIEACYLDIISRRGPLSRSQAALSPNSPPARATIGLLTVEQESAACHVIRLGPLSFLQQNGAINCLPLIKNVDKQFYLLTENFEKVDVVVVQRQAPFIIPYEKLMKLLGGHKVKIVFETDDALIHVPPQHPDYKLYEHYKVDIEEYLRRADLVTVTTPHLKSLYQPLNHHIAILPNCLDARLWPDLPEKPPASSPSPVRILFSGSPTHAADVALIEAVILTILNEFGDRVRFYFWGDTSPRVSAYPQVQAIHCFTPDYYQYVSLLRKLDVDFALVPLQDTDFNQSKSHIKWLEYSACRIPGIYSRVGAYPDYIEPGETGLLVDNTFSEWYAAIKRMIADAGLREGLARRAHQKVRQSHTLQQNADLWLQAYQGLWDDSPAKEAAVPVQTSIIIPVFNNLDYTRACLESIHRQTSDRDAWEIIVVDNGSTDGTAAFLAAEAAAGRLRLLTNRDNLGFAPACNQGARAAQGKYLLFLNNDTKVLSGWLEELVGCAQKDDRIAAVGSKLLYPDDTIQHAGVIFNSHKKVFHIYQQFDKDHPAVNKEREFQAVTGACMLVKKTLFFAAGLFDERYHNGFEDLDLCLTLRKKGYRIVYNPRSVVYHYESKTPGRHDREFANSQLLASKWYDQIVPDDEIYYREDGLRLEIVTDDGNCRTIFLHDSNENPFWKKALESKQRGDYHQAREYYLRAYKFNPYDPRTSDIAAELAELYEIMGEYADAELLYQEVAKTSPTAGHYLRLGVIQKKLHKYEDAKKSLEKAKEISLGESDDQAAWWHLSQGKHHKKQKDFPRAIQELETARAIMS